MLNLIVESGSSKTDWLLIDRNGEYLRFKTIGFNPRFHTVDFIVNEIKQHSELVDVSKKVEQINFYGAGCSNLDLNQIIKNALLEIFPFANKIEVNSDLLACARSTYENKPLITCILGTGSNSCYFDGNKIIQKTPSLGYILGDEGSGTAIGKQFLVDFLYNKIPAELKKELIRIFPHLDKDYIIERVYKEVNANVFLASFSKFLSEYIDDIYVTDLIETAFETFISNHILVYEQCREVPISFVGSVAFHYQENLKKVLSKHKLVFGQVTNKPIDGLVKYHTQVNI